MTLRTRLAGLLATWAARLTAVTAAAPGRSSDGLLSLAANGPADRPWQELSQQFTNALEAWRANPLARRTIGLISSFVVGDGITLRAEYGPLQRYLAEWWTHPQNMLDLRLTPWCEELSRAGELFVALHFNPADGISYCRLVPAASIDAITWAPGDYEQELTYHEAVGLDDPDYDKGGRTWHAPDPTFDIEHSTLNIVRPMMLHFAVNRPAGHVRGDSDLAPILNWLRRYAVWLEGRVILNAAMRAFLWIVKVPANRIAARRAELHAPPEPGTVQIIDKAAIVYTTEFVRAMLAGADIGACHEVACEAVEACCPAAARGIQLAAGLSNGYRKFEQRLARVERIVDLIARRVGVAAEELA